MLGLIVAGVALALSERRLYGTLLCLLGMAVKPNALLAVGALALWSWGTGWRDRAKGVATAAAAAVGVLFVTGIGVGGGFGWISSSLSYGSVPGPWSVGERFFGARAGWPVDVIELTGLVLAVALVIGMGRSGRWIAGLGWGFAVVAVSVPRPEPWYLTWAVAFLACGGMTRRTEQGGVIVLVSMMAGSILPLGVLWWFGGVVLLVWLGVISARQMLDRSRGPDRSESAGARERADNHNREPALSGADPAK
jgi:hypothetical protein